MRNPLRKRIPRDFKKNFPKYLGMILILVCTICIGSSFQSTLNGAVDYLEEIKDGNNQEDGFFETSEEISEETLESLKKTGVSTYENYYAVERDFTDSTKVLIFNERTQIDTPVLFEGRLPEKENEIAIDHVFANNREFKIGDTIKLLDKDYLITGTVSLPDYSSLFLNNSDLVMNTNHFCVSVVDESAFELIDSKYLNYRYSYRLENRNLSDNEKIEKGNEILKTLISNGASVQNMLRRDQNQSITFLELDIGTDGPFMTVFVYILVGMIAFIFAVLTGNTIEHESVIIGTLRASGYRRREIIWHYLQPTLIVAVTGSVVGNILGYTVMIDPFLSVYYNTYSIGPLNIKFDVASFLLTTILPVVIMLGINYIMLARKMTLTPLKFLRKELKKGKQKKTLKLPNFSFINRFRLRVIIQNRGSYIMLFIGIFLVSFLLMFGIGLSPLMDHYTDSINESLNYEYQYILKAPVEPEEGEKLLVYEMDTWFSLGKKDIGVTMFGIDEDSEYFKDAYIKDGVIVSSALANKLGLKAGDTLRLTDSNTDKEYSFEIKGVYEYNAMLSMFMDREALAALLEKESGSFNSVISDHKLDIDEAYVAKLISRSDMLGAASQMMDSFDVIIKFINIFSILIYMIIMYILTKVVIDKNAISISYMKVFGYNDREIRKLYLASTAIVAIASLIICIPLEIWLFKLTLVFLSSMIEGYMEFYLPTRVYVEIVVAGIVSYFAVNALHVRSIRKIPMTDALKNRE